MTLLKRNAPDIGPKFEYWVTAWATDGIVCIADALGSTYCEDALATTTRSTIVLSAGGAVPRLIVRGSKPGLISMRFDDGTLSQGTLTAIPGAQTALAVLPYDAGRAGSTVHLSTAAGTTVDYDLPVDDNAARSAVAVEVPRAPAVPIDAIPPSPAAPIG